MPKRTKAVKLTNRDHSWNRRKTGKQPYAKSIEVQKSFLIICEGQNTEPAYFNAFPLGNAKVESFGTGQSKTALVEHIVNDVLQGEDAHLLEVWAVFDFDVKPDQLHAQKSDFTQAIRLAEKHDIHVAWSNDCFELWFVLHFKLIEAALTRKEYYQDLSDLWKCNYEKQGKQHNFSRSIYKKLLEDPRSSQAEAMLHARRLEANHAEASWPDKNPCTTVHHLVEELNRYL